MKDENVHNYSDAGLHFDCVTVNGHPLPVSPSEWTRLSRYTGLSEAKLRDFLVPPSGVEPELPEEPHFECGASANSAKGATAEDYPKPSSGATMPHYTQFRAGRLLEGLHLAGMRCPSSTLILTSRRLAGLSSRLELPNGWEASFMYDTRGYWYVQVEDRAGVCNVRPEPDEKIASRRPLLAFLDDVVAVRRLGPAPLDSLLLEVFAAATGTDDELDPGNLLRSLYDGCKLWSDGLQVGLVVANRIGIPRHELLDFVLGDVGVGLRDRPLGHPRPSRAAEELRDVVLPGSSLSIHRTISANLSSQR